MEAKLVVFVHTRDTLELPRDALLQFIQKQGITVATLPPSVLVIFSQPNRLNDTTNQYVNCRRRVLVLSELVMPKMHSEH
jgi:hypothetical protein